MKALQELLGEVQPVPESLVRIYSHLPRESFDAERARLEQQFLDTAAKLIAMSEVVELR